MQTGLKRERIAIGFAILLPVMVVLALAKFMAPVRPGTLEEFWSFACNVEFDETGKERLGLAQSIHSPRDGWYIYGIGDIHGETVFRVRRSAAINLFPQVVAKIRSKTSTGEIARRDQWAIDALNLMEKPESDPDRFLALLQDQRLQWLKEKDGDLYQYAIDGEKAFDERWRRIQRYWVNILFECAYFASLSLFVFWPAIRCRGTRIQMLHLGVVPFLLVLPYYLGYCMWSVTSVGPVGGVLYPWICMFLGGVQIWTPVDGWLIEFLPKPFEAISQDPGPILAASGGGSTSIFAALLLWPAVYLIGCAIHRSELKKKARERQLTTDRAKPLSGVE